MAQLTIAAFLSKWQSIFAPNGARNISAADVQEFVQDLNDSFLNTADQEYTGIKGLNLGINTIAGLKSIVTVTLSTGVCVIFRDTGNGDIFRPYELVSGTAAESSPSVIRPNDFDSSANPKIWKKAVLDPVAAAEILATPLTGLDTSSTSDVNALNTILQAIGKLQANKQRTIFKDGSQAMEANLDLNSHKILQVAAATSNGEAVNFEQLNAAIDGLKPKTDCRVATTVDIVLNDVQTTDGVVLIAGNRVLVKDQSDATQNGIYIVVAGADWTRATDADTAIELQGAFVQIDEGTVNADTAWVQYSINITLGTTDLLWRQISTVTPDATSTVKGKAKLYPSTSLGTNTDGAPDQNAVKSYVDTAVAGATIADASPTVKGKAKLYTALGTNTDGSIDQNTVKTNFDLKAPLASPALTGTPTVPTAAPGTNTTQAANTAFVKTSIDALINSAPGALDTLEELADALGDDANFAATITAALALKAPLASPALTGNPTAPTLGAGDSSTKLANGAFVQQEIASATQYVLNKISLQLFNSY